MSSQRIPYISGGTRGRDHFSWERETVSDPTVDMPAGWGSPFSSLYWPVAPGIDAAMKWLWRVKTWKVNGSISFSFTAATSGGLHHGSATITVDFTDVLLPMERWNASALETADKERDLLYWMKDPASPSLKNYTFKGNAGVFQVLFVESSPNYTSGDNSPFFQTYSGTGAAAGMLLTVSSTGDGSSGTSSVPRPDVSGGGITARFTFNLMREADFFSPDIREHRLVFTDGDEDSIRPAINVEWDISANMVIGQFGSTNHPHPSVNADSFDAVDASYAESPASMDGTDVPMGGFTGSGPVTGRTSSLVIEPQEYWPFKTKSGLPVYDTATGAQINDPLS